MATNTKWISIDIYLYDSSRNLFLWYDVWLCKLNNECTTQFPSLSYRWILKQALLSILNKKKLDGNLYSRFNLDPINHFSFHMSFKGKKHIKLGATYRSTCI